MNQYIQKYKKELLLAVFFIIAVCSFIILTFKMGAFSFLKDTYSLNVHFPTIVGLVPNSDVYVYGVKAGKVDTIEIEKDGVLLTLVIDSKVSLSKKCRAEIKPKSILGEKYLEITSPNGGAPYLSEGDTIANAMIPIDIQDLVTILGDLVKVLRKEDIQNVKTILKDLTGMKVTVNTSLDNLNQTLTVSQATMERINTLIDNNSGNLHQLISNLEQSSKILNKEKLIPKTAELIGAVNKDYPKLKEDIDDLIASLKVVLDNLPENQQNFNETAKRLRVTLKKLEAIDYDDLRELIDEMKTFLKKDGINVNLIGDSD